MVTVEAVALVLVAVVVVLLPSLAGASGLVILSGSSSSSSSSLLDSPRRCSSYRFIVATWCRRCRRDVAYVSLCARTVVVRHARTKSQVRASRRRGAREREDVSRGRACEGAFEADEGVEIMVNE